MVRKSYRIGRKVGYAFRRANTFASRLVRIKSLPPKLTIRQVAGYRMKISKEYATRLVNEAGYDFRTNYRLQKVWPEQWEKVDWFLPNFQIAKAMGLSRERVRQVRGKLGIPKPRVRSLQPKGK